MSQNVQGHRVVYLPNCGAASKSLERHLRAALLVAFGDDSSSFIRQEIARCQTKEQLMHFCQNRPVESLIFVLDQFNGVQQDSTSEVLYNGSRQQIARNFLEDVRISCLLSRRLSYLDCFDIISGGIESDLIHPRQYFWILGQ